MTPKAELTTTPWHTEYLRRLRGSRASSLAALSRNIKSRVCSGWSACTTIGSTAGHPLPATDAGHPLPRTSPAHEFHCIGCWWLFIGGDVCRGRKIGAYLGNEGMYPFTSFSTLKLSLIASKVNLDIHQYYFPILSHSHLRIFRYLSHIFCTVEPIRAAWGAFERPRRGISGHI